MWAEVADIGDTKCLAGIIGELEESDCTAIYKGKGSRRESKSYHGITLLSFPWKTLHISFFGLLAEIMEWLEPTIHCDMLGTTIKEEVLIDLNNAGDVSLLAQITEVLLLVLKVMGRDAKAFRLEVNRGKQSFRPTLTVQEDSFCQELYEQEQQTGTEVLNRCH